MENYMNQKNGKLYEPKKMENYMIPQIKVRLNLHINSTLMSHQMVSIFCAHIFAHIFLCSYFETICSSN